MDTFQWFLMFSICKNNLNTNKKGVTHTHLRLIGEAPNKCGDFKGNNAIFFSFSISITFILKLNY